MACSEDNMRGLLEAALDISRKRRDILVKLKAALEAGDDIKALELARELCGVDYEKGNRTNSRVN